MEEIEFKCDVCKKECDELFSFSSYGNNIAKIEDKKNYCKKHFKEADANHEKTP